MLNGLNYLYQEIKINKNGGCVTDILRIKNGLKQIVNWKSSKDCGYCDIKLNLLVYDASTNTSMIAEIQLLLDWLLKSKKIGHKCYAILRNKEFVENMNRLYKDDCDLERYHSKILSLMEFKNAMSPTKYGLIHELIWQPHIILSMKTEDNFVLMHNQVGQSIKVFQLYLSCVFNFAHNILGLDGDVDDDDSKEESSNHVNKPVGTQFLTKYLNYNNWCQLTSYNYQTAFWGIDTAKMKVNSSWYKMIELIMKNKCFKGFNAIVGITNKNEKSKNENKSNESNEVATVVYDCCNEDCYEYLKLIFKYFEKNKNVIVKELISSDVHDNAFTVLIDSFHGDEKWMKLILFDHFEQLYHKTGIKISEKILNNVYSVCQTKQKDTKIADLIVKYAKLTNSKLDNK